MASFWDDPELMERIGALGFGLLQASGPSSDPSHRSFGAALGKGGMNMLAQMQQQKQNKMNERRIANEEEQIQMKKDAALRAAGMSAQEAGLWNQLSPKGPVKPSIVSNAYFQLGNKLASMGNPEGAERAFKMAKEYKEKYSAPITAMKDGQPILAMPGDFGGMQELSGYAPATKLEQVNVKNKILGVDPYTFKQRAAFDIGIDPNVEAGIPWSIMPTAGGGLTAVSTKGGVPTGFPVYPGKNVATVPQDQPSAQGALPVTASGAIASPESVPSNVSASLASGKSLISAIDKTIESIKKNPSAIGAKALLIPETGLKYLDPKGVKTRADIADVGSLKIVERSGATVPVGEMQRVAPFIPAASDTAEVAITKLQRLKEFQEEELANLSAQYRTIPDKPKAVSNSYEKAKSGELYTAPDGTIRRKK